MTSDFTARLTPASAGVTESNRGQPRRLGTARARKSSSPLHLSSTGDAGTACHRLSPRRTAQRRCPASSLRPAPPSRDSSLFPPSHTPARKHPWLFFLPSPKKHVPSLAACPEQVQASRTFLSPSASLTQPEELLQGQTDLADLAHGPTATQSPDRVLSITVATQPEKRWGQQQGDRRLWQNPPRVPQRPHGHPLTASPARPPRWHAEKPCNTAATAALREMLRVTVLGAGSLEDKPPRDTKEFPVCGLQQELQC